MNMFYVISILFLVISFLLYKKKDSSVNIIHSIIYSICLLICYQTTSIGILSFFHLGGTLLYYGIFNYLIGILMTIISIKRKKIQSYYFDVKDFLLVLLVFFSCFLVVLYRFRVFNIIAYASDDAAIHYRAAVAFSHVLENLTATNYLDIIHGDFAGMKTISYINGGILIHLFSNISSYRVFMVYDGFCFILYSLLFYVTISKVIKKKNYLYLFLITLLYALGFPLNNLIYGFCYLGLGVMVVHLLVYTFLEDIELGKDIIFKMVILFILSYSVFFGYYLFMPFVYGALGIYYIILFKRKKCNLFQMFLYLIVTLMIPFILGFYRFFISFFGSVDTVIKSVAVDGDIYHNAVTILFFFLVSYYLFYYKSHHKEKINFFYLGFYSLSLYTLLFFFLYMLGKSSFYYFYKLFYVYWVYALLFLGVRLFQRKKIIYGVSLLVFIGCVFIICFPNRKEVTGLSQMNVYYYNARQFGDSFIRFQKGDLEIVDQAVKYKDVCEYHHEFLTIGYYSKNMWFYSIVGSVPIINHVFRNRSQMYTPSIFFEHWENLVDYPCVIYFNEVKKLDYDKSKYNTLFENDRGVILKRKN